MKRDLAKDSKLKVSDLFHLTLIYYLNRLSLILGEKATYEHHPGCPHGYSGIWVLSINREKSRWIGSWAGDSFAINIILRRLVDDILATGYTGFSGLESDDLLAEVEQFISDYFDATRMDEIPLFSGYIDAEREEVRVPPPQPNRRIK